MNDTDWSEFLDTVRDNERLYADYFSWRSGRDVEELGVVQAFHESLAHSGQKFFHSYQSRGRGNDPPDCEALSSTGKLIGIEVTELVDGALIAATKSGASIPWEPFSESQVLKILTERLSKKDKPQNLKGGPYDEYFLIIYCDDSRVLDFGLIECIRSAVFPRTTVIDRAYVLFSYSPWKGCCPYIELNLTGPL